jgi:arylsulfatase A-like enzyme
VPGYTADLYPTLLELCSLPLQPEQHLDGRSLVSALRGESDSDLTERTLFWYYPHEHGSGHNPSAAIRRGPWKLILDLASGQTELYNLAKDPGETIDLSETDRERADSLSEQLQRWTNETTL